MFSFVKFFFILIMSLLISSCHEKDYDIIEGAKNLLLNNQNLADLNERDTSDLKKENYEKEDKKQTDADKKIEEKKKTYTDIDRDFKKNKTLKDSKKASRVLEGLEKEKEKNIENQRETKKPKKNYNTLNNKIKVGVMLPLSGEHNKIGSLILNAIEMAIFQTEENKLELHIKDTEGKPDKAKKVLAELIDAEINVVIGPLFSKSLASIQSLVVSNNINIFALTNNINLRKKGIWIFGVDPQAQTEKALQYALESGFKNIAALLPQNAYGLLLFDAISSFTETNLMKIKKIEFYDFSIANQSKAAEKLSEGFKEYQLYLEKLNKLENEEVELDDDLFMEKPFDSVFIAAYGQNLTVLSSQLQYNNVDPELVQYLGISSWEDNSILSEPALEGGVFVTTSEMYQEKINLIYKNSFRKEMPKIAMIAYDIVALLGTLDNLEDNININDLLNDEGFIGLRGLFRLKNNGTVERTFQLKKIKNKKFTILKKASDQFSGL